MITLDSTPVLKDNNTFDFSFTGLAKDTKPTPKYDGKKIANGSSFFELDTQEVTFFDIESKTWK